MMWWYGGKLDQGMDLDGRQKFFITDFGRLQAYKSRDFN